MGKCLTTKLSSSINDESLLKVGEMRIKISELKNPTINSQKVDFKFAEDSTLTIIGDGFFTDESLSVDKGKTISFSSHNQSSIFLSNGNYEISVEKYKLKYLHKFSDNDTFECNLNDFSYTALTYLNLSSTQVSGDIAALKNLTALTNLNLSSTQVSGDIAALKNLTALTYLNLSSTQVSGDIAALKNLTALTNLNLSSTQVSGDIAALKNLTALTYLSVSSTQVSGDIAALKNLTALTNFESKATNGLAGNLGDIPDNLLFFTNINGKSQFTWTVSTRKYVLAMEQVHCDNIDKMLQDMSTMEAQFKDSNVWNKTISLIGTRTSASDAAVATLQSKGYTVSITPA